MQNDSEKIRGWFKELVQNLETIVPPEERSERARMMIFAKNTLKNAEDFAIKSVNTK